MPFWGYALDWHSLLITISMKVLSILRSNRLFILTRLSLAQC